LDRVILRNDNTIAAKVNQYVVVNLNVQFLNDANILAENPDEASPRTLG